MYIYYIYYIYIIYMAKKQGKTNTHGLRSESIRTSYPYLNTTDC